MPENKEIELRSEEVQEILERMPHWTIRWGNMVVLSVLLLLLLMAWIIRYPDIVSTEITITTQIPPEKLIARTSGKIQKILVRNGMQVSENTPLAVIESSASYSDVFLLKAAVEKVKLAGGPFYFPFEDLPQLTLGEIEDSFIIFEKDYINYELNKDLQPYQADEYAHKVEALELEERLALLIEQKEISKKEQELKKNELDRYMRLHQKGVISTQEWETKNLDYLQSDKSFKDVNASISQIKSAINDLLRNKRTTKINENRDDISLYRNAMQSLNKLKKAIADWELEYVLRSSISGEVSFLQIWNENQTIASGDNVFAIIPRSQDDYVGKVKAKAQNSGKIKLGQEVNIRLSNFPDREFGVVKGKVSSISLTPDMEGNLLIDISLPNKLETTYQKKIIFQQEMTGNADIITEDLRLVERLLYQFRDIFSR